MLYFAFGSNMLTSRMVERVPSAKKVAVATLSGHKLAFHKVGVDGTGKADVAVAEADSTVYGVVYWIARSEKRYLDMFEGLHYGYETKRVNVYMESGQKMRVFLYYATAIDNTYKPSKEYKTMVVKGAHEHGLPESYIASINAVETAPVVVVDATAHVQRVLPGFTRKERPANINFTFKPRPGTPQLTPVPEGFRIKRYDEKGRMICEEVE